MKRRRLRKKLGAWLLCIAMVLTFCTVAWAEEEAENQTESQTEEQTENQTEEQAAVSAPPDGVKISDWAVEEVRAAYAAGLVPAELDLGQDYTVPISRESFVRLAVELVAVWRETDVPTLMEEYEILLAEEDVRNL